MPKANLTNSFVKRIRCPKDKPKVEYFDNTDTGFMLEVRSSANKTFYYRYNHQGKTKLTKIADASLIPADDAREVVKKLKLQKEQDRSISIKVSDLSKGTITLGEFYHTRYLPFIKTSKRSFRSDVSFFNNHILPQWSETPLDKLSRSMISQKHIELVEVKIVEIK